MFISFDNAWGRICTFLTTILISCHGDLHLKDVVVTDRFYCPDSSYVAFIYYIDNGAMGESRSMASVLKITDTLGSLDKGMLPCNKALSYNSCYFPVRWISNKTLEVTLQEVSFVKAGLPFDSSSIRVNGVDCKVVPFDDSYKRAPVIQHLSFSADRKNILVVYRYGDDYGHLNISAIKYGEKLPKYGNLVTIPEGNFDPISYPAWHGDEIYLYVRAAKEFNPADYINKGVAYKVNFVEIGQSKVPDDSALYEDSLIDESFRKEGVATKGIIVKNIWQIWNNKSAFDCMYEYKVAGQRFRTGFRVFRDFKAGAPYKIGDSVEVVYDPKEPWIHTDRISR